jgi:hypothetical protein
MPVRARRNRFHHFPPVRLHRIEIPDGDLEEALAEAVVDARHESLIVLPLFEAGDHVRRSVEHRGHQARNVLRLVLKIGRIKNEHRTAGMQISGAQGLGYSAPGPMARRGKERIRPRERLEDGPGVVHGSVINDDHFVHAGVLLEDGRRLLHEERKICRFVLGRNENTHHWTRTSDICCQGVVSRRRFGSHGRHTRLRILADKTPSWSRYLATVRRAIWTPLWRRMLTIA